MTAVDMTQQDVTLQQAEAYVGTPYVVGEFDCADLAAQVQRELFGRHVALPQHRKRPGGARGQARDIAALRDVVARRIDTPETGCGVLLYEPDGEKPGDDTRLWHIGTVFMQRGDVWVLHNSYKLGSAHLHRLEVLQRLGMQLEGFYGFVDRPCDDLPIQLLDAEPLQPEATNQLVVTPHPLVLDHRRSLPVVFAPGETLGELLERQGVLPGQQWLVEVGGALVPEAMWHRTRPKHGMVIECRRVPEKSVLRLVALIALMVYAPEVALSLGLKGFAAQLVTAAVIMAGSAVINRLLGPKPLKQDTAGNANAQTYSLTGGRNSPRLYEPMALVLGEPYAVPDVGSQAYTTFVGEDLYYTQIFHCGINCASYTSLQIGANPIADYQGVTLYHQGFTSPADTDMPDGSVDTIAGGLLDAPTSPGPYVTRTSSAGTVMLAVDIEANLYYMDADKGTMLTGHCTLNAEYRVAGSGGAWLALDAGGASVVLTSTTTKPTRVTIQKAVASGQYEVRLAKITDNSNVNYYKNDLTWSALKSYQVDTASYSGQARLAMNIKASGQLNGSLDTVNCVLTANAMPYWNGAAWVSATSRATGLSNPGAQILLLARGIYDGSGNLLAGLGWDDSRIDIEGLKRFMVWCAAKGFTFDIFLQQNTSIWDLMEAIAQAGLGQMGWPGGKLGVLWLADDAVAEGVINMANMKAKSFAVDYATVQTADELVVSYFDRDRGNSWQDVRLTAPGVATPQNSSRMQVLGVTTEAHAATVARYVMGQNVYMRKAITFEQDLEHITYQRSTVLQLSHDLTQWGYGGRLQACSNAAGILTLTLDDVVPAVSPSGATTRFIGLRLRGEAQVRVFGIAAFTGSSRTVTLATTWPGGVAVPGDSAGNPVEDCLWVYDFKATTGQKVVVTSIAPQGNLGGAQVAVTPLPDEFWPYVWTGAYTAPPTTSLLEGPPVASNLQMTEQLLPQGNTYYVDLTASFDISGSFDHAVVWGALSGSPLRALGEPTTKRQFTWRGGLGETWDVEVRPFSSTTQGTKVATTYEVQGLAVPPENFDVFTVTMQPDGTREFNFAHTTTIPPVDLAGAEIRYTEGTVSSPAWTSMKPLRSDSVTTTAQDDGFYTRSPVETNLLLAGDYTFAIRARDTTRNLSTTPLYISGTLPDRRLGNVLEEFNEGGEGWTGTKTNCLVVDGNLEATDSTTWATLPATWTAWTRWNYAPAASLTYMGPVRDLGIAVGASINATVDADGTVVQELRYSNVSGADVLTQAWGGAGASFTARWFQMRITVTGTGPAPVAMVRAWKYSVNAAVKKEYLNDQVISTYTGGRRIGTGDVRIPVALTYGVIKRVSVVIQDGTATAWTWALLDKTTTGPRVQFRANGVLTDPAYVDFYIEGA